LLIGIPAGEKRSPVAVFPGKPRDCPPEAARLRLSDAAAGYAPFGPGPGLRGWRIMGIMRHLP
jgi:hypothetical protein